MSRRQPPPPRTPWRNRIVDHTTEDPNTLTPNPLNARTHPADQRAVLNSVLNQVGWVQNVIVNRTTGRLLDGHARVEEAIANGEAAVPVTWVELTEEEETNMLAVLDPISALAAYDADTLVMLLDSVTLEDDATQRMLNDLAKAAGLDAERTAAALPSDPEPQNPDAETDFRCPHCGYEWDGAPR